MKLARRTTLGILFISATQSGFGQIPAKPVDVNLSGGHAGGIFAATFRAAALEDADKTNVPKMRKFAWSVFFAITRPSHDQKAPDIPKWMSWCTRSEMVMNQCPGDDKPQLDRSKLYWAELSRPVMEGRMAQGVTNVLSSVYYSPKAIAYLTTAQQFDKGPLKGTSMSGPLNDRPRTVLRDALHELDRAGARPEDRDIPSMPPSAVVVKTAWYLVKDPARNNKVSPQIRVWDGLRSMKKDTIKDGSIPIEDFPNPVALKFSGLHRRTDCGAELKAFPRTATVNAVSAANFFYYELCSADEAKGATFLCAGGDCRPEAGDILILVGIHVITHEVEGWTWSTFWWHRYDPSDNSEFARNRPLSLRRDPVWANYLMDVTLDEEMPLGRGLSQKTIFNPYLEAQMQNGYKSNCMSCHRLAAVHCVSRGDCHPKPGVPYCGELRIPVPPNYSVPQRGTPPTHSLFDGSIRTSFLWTIADYTSGEDTDTPGPSCTLQ